MPNEFKIFPTAKKTRFLQALSESSARDDDRGRRVRARVLGGSKFD